MGIFDFFKKKITDSTFPENDLESVLMKAANDPAARNAFYTKLLWSELYLLTEGRMEGEEGVKTLEKDTAVKFVTFETGQIPVFSSTNRIFDKGIIKHEVPYIALKGQNLFAIAKGATFILNPYSAYGKELLPQEIEDLMSGKIFNRRREIVIEKETTVQVGQPAKYPKDLVKALSELFKTNPKVNAAYLAVIKMDKDESLPHLLIGIDTVNHFSAISKQAGFIAERFLSKNEILDFIQIDNNEGISDYLTKETKPFYLRK